MYQGDLRTMSGMWAVWDQNAYAQVDSYEKWEPLFCEDRDLKAQIAKKTFVPVYIFEDGCRAFTVKVDAGLNDREANYICVQSDPYLLKCTGKIYVSGIESIGKNVTPEEAIGIELPDGHYSVQVYLLSWYEEPGAYLENGNVSPDALSDFVVLIRSNADPAGTYRERLNTFSEDDGQCE